MKKVLAAVVVALSMTGCASVCSDDNRAHLLAANAQLARLDAEINACNGKPGKQRCPDDLTVGMRWNSGNAYYAALIDDYNSLLLRQQQAAAQYNKACTTPWFFRNVSV